MKILVVCQHYWPEPFRITEICEDLVRRGHEVTAVVGLPNYPSGIIPPEYRWFRRRREQIHGVTVRRCFEVGRRNTKLGLAVNYCSYMISATWKVLTMRKRHDVVFAYSTSPVLMSMPAALLRCVSRKKLLIDVLDIWPACLAAMNVYEGSMLYAFMKRVSRWIYARADMLVYSSKRFQAYLQTVHGITVPEAQYWPQFADSLFDQLPKAAKSSTVNLVFAGNIGKVQSVETLIHAAALLRDEPVHFHIVGDGSGYEACRTLAATLSLQGSLTFHGRKPITDMPAYYAMADAMLVSMKYDVSVNDTLPGKVQSYMAAGKPILGSIAGETPLIIAEAQCGYCAPPEDAQAFAQIVRRFVATQDKATLGQNARAYYERHFTKQGLMDQLEAMLQSLVEGAHEDS